MQHIINIITHIAYHTPQHALQLTSYHMTYHATTDEAQLRMARGHDMRHGLRSALMMNRRGRRGAVFVGLQSTERSADTHLWRIFIQRVGCVIGSGLVVEWHNCRQVVEWHPLRPLFVPSS